MRRVFEMEPALEDLSRILFLSFCSEWLSFVSRSVVAESCLQSNIHVRDSHSPQNALPRTDLAF